MDNFDYFSNRIRIDDFFIIISPSLVALLTTQISELDCKDPIVGAGPIVTVIQDTISIVVFGIVASLIILT